MRGRAFARPQPVDCRVEGSTPANLKVECAAWLSLRRASLFFFALGKDFDDPAGRGRDVMAALGQDVAVTSQAHGGLLEVLDAGLQFEDLDKLRLAEAAQDALEIIAAGGRGYGRRADHGVYPLEVVQRYPYPDRDERRLIE